jgi:single-strand DNA-binding protein
VNCTQQIGRLAADPTPVKATERGVVTTFRLAVPRPKGSAQEADFFTVEVWQRLAEACAEYLRRGREVAVEGRLDQRAWRTPTDEPRERVVIVARSVRFLRHPSNGDHPEPAPQSTDAEIPF